MRCGRLTPKQKSFQQSLKVFVAHVRSQFEFRAVSCSTHEDGLVSETRLLSCEISRWKLPLFIKRITKNFTALDLETKQYMPKVHVQPLSTCSLIMTLLILSFIFSMRVEITVTVQLKFIICMHTWTRYCDLNDDLRLTPAGRRERPDGDLVLCVVLEVEDFLWRSFCVIDNCLENVTLYAARRYIKHTIA